MVSFERQTPCFYSSQNEFPSIFAPICRFTRRLVMITRLRCLTAFCVLLIPMIVRAQGVTTEPIDQALGRAGQKTGDVYRLSFPRTDLHVSVHGLAIKPGLALGSWAAFLC